MRTTAILQRVLLPCVCLVAMATMSMASDDIAADDQLVIWPAKIVVRPDYPAQVVVMRLCGEQAVDETRNAKLQTPSSALSIDQQGRISLSNPGELATTELQIELGSLTAAVPVEVIGGPAPSPIFPREVAAILGKSGCNLGTCHGNLHGKAGFRLSLRGDDPVLDFASIVRAQGGRAIDRVEPAESLLLRKPLGLLAHQGGVRFTPDSIEAQMLQRWIREGCRWNAGADVDTPDPSRQPSGEEQLEQLDVFPNRCLLSSSCRQQQLVVIATFGDGSRRDVTHFARFEPSVASGVDVSPDGLVTAEQPIDVSISVSYLSGRAASRLTFLPNSVLPSSALPNTALPNSVTADAHSDSFSKIDQLVDEQLRRLQVPPEPIADDYVFVRRAHLAIAGRLPTAEEVQQYCEHEQRSDKRERLVERILNEPGYAWLWSMRWSDLLRNEQKVMSEQGAAQWHAWMTAQVANDRPLDQFVSEMITTLGSTYEHPPASFHRTHRDPETAAESIGQVFLGVRLQCARCHNHPFDKWRQDDYYGLAAYFTTLERKQVNNEPKDKFDKHIISGDEVISLKDTKATIWHPGRSSDVFPKPLGAAFTGSGSDELSRAPLESLARWLTVDNRLFARNLANRVWYHFMGVGIVDPPDDFRDSNPPSNPELLEYLTDELIASGYSARHLARLIVTSQTFARRAIGEPSRDAPLGGARVFSGYPLRRLPAEVLLDAISSVTDVYSTEARLRSDALAIAQANVPTKASFLNTFGKPGRLLVCECERSSDVSLGQSLVLINGTETRDKLSHGNNYLSRVMSLPLDTSGKVEQLYLTTLSRPPRPQELAHFSNYISTANSPRAAFEDVLWALMNSKEFSLLR